MKLCAAFTSTHLISFLILVCCEHSLASSSVKQENIIISNNRILNSICYADNSKKFIKSGKIINRSDNLLVVTNSTCNTQDLPEKGSIEISIGDLLLFKQTLEQTKEGWLVKQYNPLEDALLLELFYHKEQTGRISYMSVKSQAYSLFTDKKYTVMPFTYNKYNQVTSGSALMAAYFISCESKFEYFYTDTTEQTNLTTYYMHFIEKTDLPPTDFSSSIYNKRTHKKVEQYFTLDEYNKRSFNKIVETTSVDLNEFGDVIRSKSSNGDIMEAKLEYY